MKNAAKNNENKAVDCVAAGFLKIYIKLNSRGMGMKIYVRNAMNP
jgi:hypothetical protein